MRTIVPEKLERGRIHEGHWGSDASYGMCGAFNIVGPCGLHMVIIVADPHDPPSAARAVSCAYRGARC